MLASGTSPHTRRSLKWLFDSGQDVILVDKNHPGFEESKQFKFILYPVARLRRYYSWLGKSNAEHIAQCTIIFQLKMIKHKSKADLTHVFWVNKRAYQVVKARLHPLILSVLGSDVNRFFEEKCSYDDRVNMGKVLASADLVLVDSVEMISRCQTLAEGKAKVIFFPIGINTKSFSVDYSKQANQWKEKLKIEKDGIALVSFRAMNPIYNHHLILDAFFAAIPHLLCPAYLIFKDFNMQEKAYKEKLKEQVKQRGVENKVRWVEEDIPDCELPAFYSFADVFINFPTYDAFPISFVEAAAAGKPVISCCLPAYKETFAEKYFTMIEKKNVDALTKEIIRFVNCETNNNLEGRKQAKEWVQANYDESKSKENLLNIYQVLIENKHNFA